jgi:Protein of unknown function (DUF3563)
MLPQPRNKSQDKTMRTTAPIDGWSAYYALLTDALSASPQARSRQPAKPRRSWLTRLDDWFADQRSLARERYLAQATDLSDLERRMREIDRYHYF